MSTESAVDELLLLIEQTHAQVTYAQELGVAGIKLDPARTTETKKQSPGQSSRSSQLASSTPSVSSPNSTLTERNRVESVQPQLPEPGAPTLPRDSLFGDLTPAAETFAQSAETLEEIWEDLENCTRCPLHKGRTNIVHTEGNRQARLMFVGEAPGADEDAQARPFVGRAGQLLTKIIESLGLKREQVLIGNVNRCRPPGNRPPTQEEAAICKPFLLREIAAVQPEVIVVLGNTAVKNLLDTRVGITRLRGQFQDYKGIKIMPTFHPAYLLRDPSKKRETWEDLKKVRDYLDSTAKRDR